jgi:hypothetical protein
MAMFLRRGNPLQVNLRTGAAEARGTPGNRHSNIAINWPDFPVPDAGSAAQ